MKVKSNSEEVISRYVVINYMLITQPFVGNGLDRSAELDDILLSYIVCDEKSCIVLCAVGFK